MAEVMTAQATLETGMRFDAESGSGHHVTLDAAEHVVTGHHIQPEAVTRAIALSEERYCGAGAMLGKVAHLTHTYRIVEAAETVAVATPLA